MFPPHSEMKIEKNNAESWAPCEPGTLSSYARQAQTKRRNQNIARAAGVSVIIFCVLGLGAWGVSRLSSEQENHLGGIACSEVRENMKAYTMGGLPTELKKRMSKHLQECPHCQEMMRQMNRSAFKHSNSDCSCTACRQLAQHTLPPQTLPAGRLGNQQFSSTLLLVANDQ